MDTSDVLELLRLEEIFLLDILDGPNFSDWTISAWISYQTGYPIDIINEALLDYYDHLSIVEGMM